MNSKSNKQNHQSLMQARFYKRFFLIEEAPIFGDSILLSHFFVGVTQRPVELVGYSVQSASNANIQRYIARGC